MKVAFFSTKEYDTTSFMHPAADAHTFTFIPEQLSLATAHMAHGHDAVCIFVNDSCDADVLSVLKCGGVRCVTLRCAGFNNVDLEKAKELGMSVARVPAYSPESVAEFAVGHILTIVRKYHKAHKRVSDGNFLLSGLVGFNLCGKTVGIIGTGKIGMITGKILAHGFNCNVIAYDPYPNPTAAAAHGLSYTTLTDLLARSDIISLHCPLTPQTKHILNGESLAQTKPGVVIVNTSRGGLIDTRALVDALASGHVRAAGLDVYEREDMHFFRDGSTRILGDEVLERLLGLHNVLITGHQAFLTEEALENIAHTTLMNLSAFETGNHCPNAVHVSA